MNNFPSALKKVRQALANGSIPSSVSASTEKIAIHGMAKGYSVYAFKHDQDGRIKIYVEVPRKVTRNNIAKVSKGNGDLNNIFAKSTFTSFLLEPISHYAGDFLLSDNQEVDTSIIFVSIKDIIESLIDLGLIRKKPTKEEIWKSSEELYESINVLYG